MNTEAAREYAEKLYASAFYAALALGLSEKEADAAATKKVNSSIHLKKARFS